MLHYIFIRVTINNIMLKDLIKNYEIENCDISIS